MSGIAESLVDWWPGVSCVTRVSELASVPGSYLLELEVSESLKVEIGRFGPIVFSPGVYLYAGSAKGPGGLRARVGRHLRTDDKRLRWHIDYLIAATGVRAALVAPHTSECEFVERLEGRAAVDVPIPGFGSSDCKACRSHLLRWVGESSKES